MGLPAWLNGYSWERVFENRPVRRRRPGSWTRSGGLSAVPGCIEQLESRALLSAGDLPATVVVNQAIYSQETKPTPQAHATTIVETENGKFVAAWFGGTAERNPDTGIWISRFDGQNWSTPEEVATGAEHESQDYACWNPVLFKHDDGRLTLYYKVGLNPREWWGRSMTSTDGGVTWSDSVRLPDPILGPIKNKPVQLSDGTIISPTSVEITNTDWNVYFEISHDDGQTWQRVGPIAKNGFEAIQPTILVHPDGRLQALCRSRQGVIVETWSNDNGMTWSALQSIGLPNPNAGFDAVNVSNGQFALVYNPTNSGRTPLVVALSDDGVTWHEVAVLENVPGEYSYPAIIQSDDGRLHVTYTWQRLGVHHAVIELPNHSPVVSAPVDVSFAENAAPQVVNLLRNATDPEPWNVLQVTGLVRTGGNAVGVRIDPSGNRLIVDPAAYRYLPVNAQEVITYRYTISDGKGGTVQQTAKITIRGLSVAPELAIPGGDAPQKYKFLDPFTPPPIIAPTLFLRDTDSRLMSKAIVTISGNYRLNQDKLDANLEGTAIRKSWLSATGELILQGNDTVANYLKVLRSVRFVNLLAVGSPHQSSSPRTISFQAFDELNIASNIARRALVFVSANAVPVVSTNTSEALNYKERTHAVVIAPALTVRDADNLNLQSAVIRISGNYKNGEDKLLYKKVFNITGVFDAATGKLTLTGSDTLDRYQAAIRSIQYVNTSKNPSVLPRTISFTVSDGLATSAATTRTVKIIPVNDPPQLFVRDLSPLVYQSSASNSGAVAILPKANIELADPDNLLTGATIRVMMNYQKGKDLLSFVNTATIRATFDANTGILRLSGNDTVANYRTALSNVKYTYVGTTETVARKMVSFTVFDGKTNSAMAVRAIQVQPPVGTRLTRRDD